MPTPSQTEYLDIDGIPLAIEGAWEWLDLSPLWQGAEKVGANRRLPRGRVRSYPRYGSETVRDIEGYIYGFRDVNGVPFSNARVGLEANISFLQEEIEAQPDPIGDGTRPATLHMPSGATRTADVHVIALRLAAFGPSAARAVWELSIPTGALAYDGS